ncbi:MAG TPA: hypothetical protein VNE18_06525 [Rhodanobacter sp.]|nr:hypothetical protein [Rhodanobacter sp.]
MLTIEGPVEYLHLHKQSVLDQREIGLDTLSYVDALKHPTREAPGMVGAGETRDRDIVQRTTA